MAAATTIGFSCAPKSEGSSSGSVVERAAPKEERPPTQGGPRLLLRPSAQRGHENYGWLDAQYTFSFGGYYNPNFMGFRALRVMNEATIVPSSGFPMHPHQDMEIITLVFSGALDHQDSVGGGGTIRPGVVQHMSAGTGIRHREFNPSSSTPAHVLQIWLLPEERRIKPRYQEVAVKGGAGDLRLVASRNGRDGSMVINQDVAVHSAILSKGQEAAHHTPAGRHTWIQVARGALSVNGQEMKAGDGAATSDSGLLAFRALENTEFIVFDLA